MPSPLGGLDIHDSESQPVANTMANSHVESGKILTSALETSAPANSDLMWMATLVSLGVVYGLTVCGLIGYWCYRYRKHTKCQESNRSQLISTMTELRELRERSVAASLRRTASENKRRMSLLSTSNLSAGSLNGSFKRQPSALPIQPPPAQLGRQSSLSNMAFNSNSHQASNGPFPGTRREAQPNLARSSSASSMPLARSPSAGYGSTSNPPLARANSGRNAASRSASNQTPLQSIGGGAAGWTDHPQQNLARKSSSSALQGSRQGSMRRMNSQEAMGGQQQQRPQQTQRSQNLQNFLQQRGAQQAPVNCSPPQSSKSPLTRCNSAQQQQLTPRQGSFRGGGGNNLYINTPQQSSLGASPALTPQGSFRGGGASANSHYTPQQLRLARMGGSSPTDGIHGCDVDSTGAILPRMHQQQLSGAGGGSAGWRSTPESPQRTMSTGGLRQFLSTHPIGPVPTPAPPSNRTPLRMNHPMNQNNNNNNGAITGGNRGTAGNQIDF